MRGSRLSTTRTSDRRAAIWLAGFTLLCFAYFLPRWHDWNQDARLDMTMAIVNHGTVAIDAYQFNTGDDDFFQGHYYSNKAPGQSLLGVPVLIGFRGLLGLAPIRTAVDHIESNGAWNIALQDAQCFVFVAGDQCRFVPPVLDFAILQYLESILTAAVPSVLLLLLFFWFLGRFSRSTFNRSALTIGLGLGTIVFPYSQNFYSHVPAALLVFTAFVLVYLAGVDKATVHLPRFLSENPRSLLFLAGFAVGLAAVFEYPMLLVLPVLGLYVLYRLGLRAAIILGLSAVPPLCIDLAYNLSAYHNPFTTGYGCLETQFKHLECHGVGGFTLPPSGNALSGMSISRYRGLLFLSPMLALGLPGYILWMIRRPEDRVVALAALSIIGGLFLAICCYSGWWGGQVVGPRYIMPIVPLLALPIIFMLDEFRDVMSSISIFGLGLMSVLNVWLETVGGRQFGWTSIHDPLFDWNIPQLLQGQTPLNLGMLLGLTGWRSLLPLALFLASWSAVILIRVRPIRTAPVALPKPLQT